MKLEKAEKIVLLALVLTLALALGHAGASRKGSAAFAAEPLALREQAREPVNINTAGETELMALPGIGETLAGRIVAYREEHGPFTVIDDITAVEGVGNALFGRICRDITVG